MKALGVILSLLFVVALSTLYLYAIYRAGGSPRWPRKDKPKQD